MLLSRNRRRGNVGLPFYGIIQLATIYLPIWTFPLLLYKWHEFQNFGGLPPPVAVPGGAFFWIVAPLVCFPFFILCIAIPMLTSELEASSERAGLGAVQFWSGKNLKEKLCREFARLGLLLSSIGLGWWIVSLTLSQYPIVIKVWGLACYTEILIILLYLCVVNPVKKRWPTFGGFSGNPEARYDHAF